MKYHFICIMKSLSDDEKEKKRTEFNKYLKDLLIDNNEEIKFNIFDHEVEKFRSYNFNKASFFISKLNLKTLDLDILNNKIRNNISDILVLRFIKLNSKISQISDEVIN